MSRRVADDRLEVPLERLHRRNPLRVWSAGVRASELTQRLGLTEPLKIGEVTIVDSAEIEIRLELDLVGEGVVATGDVTAPYVGPCSRCLAEVTGAVTAHVRELFEADPEEGETYPLGEDHIDLTPLVRDAVLLDLPIVVSCPDRSTCDYEEPVVPDEPAETLGDPRWAVLDELRLGDD